jgi:hypothetical protein
MLAIVPLLNPSWRELLTLKQQCNVDVEVNLSCGMKKKGDNRVSFHFRSYTDLLLPVPACSTTSTPAKLWVQSTRSLVSTHFQAHFCQLLDLCSARDLRPVSDDITSISSYTLYFSFRGRIGSWLGQQLGPKLFPMHRSHWWKHNLLMAQRQGVYVARPYKLKSN